MPAIVGELRGIEQQGWIITSYILAVCISMPLYGRLGGLIGRRGLFIAAIGIFLAPTGAAATSPLRPA